MKAYKSVLFATWNSKLEHPECGQEL